MKLEKGLVELQNCVPLRAKNTPEPMKRLFFLFFLTLPLLLSAQKKYPPVSIDSTKVVITVTAKTTDEELFKIRKDLLRFTIIRFVNFDVIRGKDGDIYFLSMHVDCRDGYNGNISHSFEKGDESVWGFCRYYKKRPYQRPFFIGDLTDKLETIFSENTQESTK